MGQATPHRPLALVVEDDADQRFIASTLIEELGMNVIQCESAEAAKLVMDKCGTALSLLFTDINLAGRMTGLELAEQARRRYPNLPVVVTSGNACPKLPHETFFLPKPWSALDVIIQAERAVAVSH